MSEPTPYALSQLFSQLVDRDVKFALTANPAASKARPIYGVYSVFPDNRPLVVKADLPMLGCLAAALLGLPEDTAVERALETPMNEPVRDAMHEVLNIASTALSTNGRVVLKSMLPDPVYFPSDAIDLLQTPDLKSTYNVSINDEAKGLFTLFSLY